MRPTVLAGLLALISVCSGCTDFGEPVPAGPGPSAVSFASQIQPIFDGSCATGGCHLGTTPQADLSLQDGLAYGNLVGIDADGYAAQRIVSGDPAASVLYNKVANTGVFGGRMPPFGGLLPPAQVELIRTWILEGALDN